MMGIFRKKANDKNEIPKGKTSQVAFHPDRPIQTVNEDRLGFAPIAENLATSILKMNVDEGFVIGIEGAWGSGKSSILNLLCSKIDNEDKFHIIKFSPWVVGDRDSMVSSLIGEISVAIEKITGNKSVAKIMRQYGLRVSKLAPLVDDIPYAKGVGKAIEMFSSSKPLDVLKGDLAKALRGLEKTFVVIVDDLDRLEPGEALEIMRLIRAVGDFPNVIYVLCYDRTILSQSLKTALHIEDGNSFLQKIIQASFPVPKPEEFDLRNWLTEELHLLHRNITGESLSEAISERLTNVCYTQGGEIETPREVNLTLNSLRLTYPPIVGKVDFPDLCWLHITKIKNDALYRWTENYLNAFSIFARGEGNINEDSHTKMAEELLTHLHLSQEKARDSSAIRIFINLQEHLPGIASYLSENENPRSLIFGKLSEDELSALERGHRLGSPSHSRLYFSFNQPSGTMSDEELSSIINKANAKSPISEYLRKYIDIKRPQGGSMYSVLLARLKRFDNKNLNADGAKMLIQGLVATIDEALRKETDSDRHFKIGIGRMGNQVIQNILPKIDQAERGKFLKNLFENGISIGWLVSHLMGNELFSHGKIGDRNDSSTQILTGQELEMAIKIINARLTGNDRPGIIDTPQPLSFFYRWQQSGDAGKENLLMWMNEFSETDSGFLQLLEKCRGYVVSSDRGAYRPLSQSVIDDFFRNPQEVMKRVENIAQNTKDESLRKQAQGLIEALKMDRFN